MAAPDQSRFRLPRAFKRRAFMGAVMIWFVTLLSQEHDPHKAPMLRQSKGISTVLTQPLPQGMTGSMNGSCLFPEPCPFTSRSHALPTPGTGRSIRCVFPTPMDQHLTVREARAFTRKSESTLKRLIREVTAEPNHPDRSQILPAPDEVERRKKAGDVFVWKINQDFLLRRFPKTDEEGSSASQAKPSTESRDTNATIKILQDQLQSKDRQIQTLETQLDRKDEQIKSLNDLMHETNVLMHELQARLAIAPPATTHTTDATIVAGESKVKAKPSPAKQPAQKKRRSFIDRFFGGK